MFRPPSLFSILLCCSLILQLFKLIVFFSLIYTPHLIMTKWKQNFRNVYKFIKKKKTEISHLHKYSDPLQQHLKFSSGAWLESTCGKINWVDMIWKGTHLSIKGLTALYCWDFPWSDWCVCDSLCSLRAAVHWIQRVYVWLV